MAINIIGNTLVLSEAQQIDTSCAAAIGFRSVLINSTFTGQEENPLHPFTNCLDFRDNTQYSPLATSGSVVIEFNQLSPTDIDYIGIGIHNGTTAGLSGKLEVFILNGWVEVSQFAPIGDNRTMMALFDPVSTSRQRITLNFTSQLFIGNIYIGKAWVFDKTPSLGFTPGHTNSLDILESFNSETNQFMMGRVIKRGFGQKGQFDFINWSEGDNSFELQYVDYMNHVKSGKAVFMKWNKRLQQNFFGRAANPNSLQPPTYSSNTTGTFYFDFKGFA